MATLDVEQLAAVMARQLPLRGWVHGVGYQLEREKEKRKEERKKEGESLVVAFAGAHAHP
jgi:hypothetical protein